MCTYYVQCTYVPPPPPPPPPPSPHFTASRANPPATALRRCFCYGTLGQHSLQCMRCHHQAVEHGQLQNKTGMCTCVWLTYKKTVCSWVDCTCICTYVRTYVHVHFVLLFSKACTLALLRTSTILVYKCTCVLARMPNYVHA